MRRSARPLLYAGVLAVVFGLAKVHAEFIGHYDLTGSARFAWTIVYTGVLCTTAYGFGLPDGTRTKRATIAASVGASFTGALAISVVQLVVGDALLPRFVVFGSALVLPDWYRLCGSLSAGGRLRAEQRDRILVIGRRAEVAELELELHGLPERPASIVAGLDVAAAAVRPGHRPVEDLALAHEPTVLVLDREAADDPGVIAQAAVLHERGVRIRTLTAFYDEWLGKLPMSELERASLFFDIGEVHRSGYLRAKRLVDLPLAALGCIALAVVTPMVWSANRVGNRGPLFYRQVRVGKGGRPFTLLKFSTMVHAAPGAE
jgi:hypothetical protein